MSCILFEGRSLIGKVPFGATREVLRVRNCCLCLERCSWDFATNREAEISAHWGRRKAENPDFFNGGILVMQSPRIESGTFFAELIQTDFKSYLFWRESGFPEAGVFDGFGAALIRSADGAVLLGRQGAGNINSGLAYLPGGFIDPRDVREDGSVSIDESIARELVEETGLNAEELRRRPGYYVTVFGAKISIAVEYCSALPADALRRTMLNRIATQDDPELEDIVAVSERDLMSSSAMADYVQMLLPAVVSAPGD